MTSITDTIQKIRGHSSGNLGKGTPEGRIKKIEERLGVAIPASYRTFLMEVGYAELFGDEIYSDYDVPDDRACLGILHQNLHNPLLTKGWLVFFQRS